MKHSLPSDGNVSRETLLRLEAYARLLLKWNSKINLVGRHTEADLWQRHFDDSLQMMTLVPRRAQTAVDLGSGAGFPGLVLALALGLTFDLVEADKRKAGFLREVAAMTEAPVRIHCCRIEDLQLPLADLVTARALAPMPRLLPMIEARLKPSGVALLHKGEQADRELADSSTGWRFHVEQFASRTDPQGALLRLSEVHRVTTL